VGETGEFPGRVKSWIGGLPKSSIRQSILASAQEIYAAREAILILDLFYPPQQPHTGQRAQGTEQEHTHIAPILTGGGIVAQVDQRPGEARYSPRASRSQVGKA